MVVYPTSTQFKKDEFIDVLIVVLYYTRKNSLEGTGDVLEDVVVTVTSGYLYFVRFQIY